MPNRLFMFNAGCVDEPCCAPCCVVARVVVRECVLGYLAEGVTVDVREKAEDHAGDVVASGTTDETGTVALILPPKAGRRYEAVADVDGKTSRHIFTSKCGVNTVDFDLGGVQEICLNVVDSETESPVAGIPAILTVTSGLTSRAIGSAVSGSDGRACFEVGAGGEYQAQVNVGPGANPDYLGGGAGLLVPECGPFEQDVPIRLIENHPGCAEIITRGCWCYLPGVQFTMHIREYKPVAGALGYPIPGVTVITDKAITVTSDAAGRAWLCPTEDVPLLTGVYYNADTDEYASYGMTSADVEPPAPYVPYFNMPPTTQANGYWYDNFGRITTHSWTRFPGGPNGLLGSGDPPYQFCGHDCTADMPETLTATKGGDWPVGFPATLTLTRDPLLNYYRGCVDFGAGSSFILDVILAWTTFSCDPFEPKWGIASLYRVGKTCASTAIVGSESVFHMRGVSGTTACPVNFVLQTYNVVVVNGTSVFTPGGSTLAVVG